MLKGTTYMVRPFIEPRNSSSSLARISAGAFQLLVGPASASLVGADEGAVLDPGDVARVGVGPVGTGPLRRVELGEGAGVDQLLAEERVLLVGPVEPVDVVRLAELDHLVDPREQSGVSGGGLHERHVAPPGDRKWVPTTVTTRAAPRQPETVESDPDDRTRSSGAGQTWAVGRPMSTSEPRRTLGGAAVGVEVEVDPLALAQGLEERALERVGGEGELGAVGLVDDDALTRERVEHADDALHDADPTASGPCPP